MGKGTSESKCSVEGCNEQAVRSIAFDKAKVAGLKLSEGRRAYVCKTHYKEIKRKMKKDKMVEKWRYSS
jgi:hypothetical protein